MSAPAPPDHGQPATHDLASIASSSNATLQVPVIEEKPKWVSKLSLRPRKRLLLSADDADVELTPEATAGYWDIIFFGWITPLLRLGYKRPLEITDLYVLQGERAAAYISEKILASYQRQQRDAEAYNVALSEGKISPTYRKLWWSLLGRRADREQRWRETGGRRKASLLYAMHDSIKAWFWWGGVFRLIADMSEVCTSLLVKAIITFATESYHQSTGAVPPIGRGVGLALGLLLLQLLTLLTWQHSLYRSYSTGVLLRGGLITSIFGISLDLTSRARSTLTNGKLVNHLSTDISRIDTCCSIWHVRWTSVFKIALCLALLVNNLGPSALAGFAFLAIAIPAQRKLSQRLSVFRKKSMVWTDKRVKLAQELLGGIHAIKVFGWELPFIEKLAMYRQQEMRHLRSLLVLRAVNDSIAISLPILASVLTFITYAASGHELTAATVFSSLTILQMLRNPMAQIVQAFNYVTDAETAVERLSLVFEAETHDQHTLRVTDEALSLALQVTGAIFKWDAPGTGTTDSQTQHLEAPGEWHGFELQNISMQVARGQLAAIVGPVGAGKSSLLQGILGEMRRTSGSVTFGGSVSYCAQSSWIQNATIRENICFGQPFDEDRYWDVIHDVCLDRDLALFPDGDLTEVGEKGVSLSGGQKQRVNIARAVYRNADIQVFDDCLSALDPDVAQRVFNNVLLNGARDKTRILVTHALNFLPLVDYIFVLEHGKIVERGTYAELMAAGASFADLQCKFISDDDDSGDEASDSVQVVKSRERRKSPDNKAPTAVMVTEDRAKGSVPYSVYLDYFRSGSGLILVPLAVINFVIYEGATVMSSYWLVYWQDGTFHQSQGFYMGIFGAIGGAQAVFMFFASATVAILTYFASRRLHDRAIVRVMHAPMLFFETNPLGRILNRLSKDVDTLDNMVSMSLRSFVSRFADIIGAAVFIAVLVPWFLIAVAAMAVVYTYVCIFYRASATELKRLDAILRSSLYSHFSESLSGLNTIRAYGEAGRFARENTERVDIENRAYWLTISNQRWLGLRLDACGAALTFVVAMLTVGTRFTISPSQTGVLLSFILSVQSTLAWSVRQYAELENSMSSVERVIHYANETEQEGNEATPIEPAKEWPSAGELELKDVVLGYRPGLPDVLHGISFVVNAGEKVGIVGRTGAGKSSIIAALTRMVELRSGAILIDGVNTAQVNLQRLRRSLCIIPQESVLFEGTLRSNLDPFQEHDDAELYNALKRSHLNADNGKAGDHQPLTLDSPIEAEGANVSVGQRSLVSLARALVRNARILLLDEATASVDYETDQRIQETIAREFRDRTILCIAHRLTTIMSYDKIAVLDGGRLVEFDTPARLFALGGIFREMCERSGIAVDDIERAAAARRAL